MLEDLEERRLFTQRLPEDGWYRYHEVLRSHLQAVLLEEVGAAGLRDRFCLAGELLVESGALAEGVEAFCRGESWEDVRRLLGLNGREVADRPSDWLDAIPAAIVSNDPWLLLANARRLRAHGRLAEAADAYRRAETAFGPTDAGPMCRAERQAIGHWLDRATVPAVDRRDPIAILRIGLRGDPLAAVRAAEALQTPEGEIVAGLAAIAAGYVARARRDLAHVADRAETGRVLHVTALLAAGVAGLLMGQRHAVLEVEGAVAAAEEAGIEWLARVGRATLALTGSDESLREAEAVAEASRRLGDRWGEAVARLSAAWGSALRAARSASSIRSSASCARSTSERSRVGLAVWLPSRTPIGAISSGATRRSPPSRRRGPWGCRSPASVQMSRSPSARPRPRTSRSSVVRPTRSLARRASLRRGWPGRANSRPGPRLRRWSGGTDRWRPGAPSATHAGAPLPGAACDRIAADGDPPPRRVRAPSGRSARRCLGGPSAGPSAAASPLPERWCGHPP